MGNEFQFEQINGNFIITFGLVLLVGLFLMGRHIAKNNKGLTLGEIINKMLIREKVSIFVIGMILLNIAEAIMAASIHTSGEMPINPLARFLSHSMISMLAIVCGIYWPSLFREVLNPSSDKMKEKKKSIFALMIIVLIGAVAFPYMNLALIAGGLRESHLMNYAYQDIFMNMVPTYEAFGLGAGFSAWAAMSYAMKTSYAMTWAHYFLTFLDGMFIIVFGDDWEKSGDDKKEGKKGKKDKEDSLAAKEANKGEKLLEKIEDVFKFLLKRYGYSKPNLQDAIDKATKKLDSIADRKDQIRFASKSEALVEKIKKYDLEKDTVHKHTNEQKKDRNSEFKTEIRTLFAGSTKNGNGLGHSLKAKK